MSAHVIRVSPSGVSHLVFRNCATCGNGPHDEWPALPAGVEVMHGPVRAGLLLCCGAFEAEIPNGHAITYNVDRYPITCAGAA